MHKLYFTLSLLIVTLQTTLSAGHLPLPNQGLVPAPTMLHLFIESNNELLIQDAVHMIGASPNAQDHQGNTPLHIAAQYNNINAIRILLNLQANPIIQNAKQETPLHIAAVYGNLNILDILLNNGGLPTINTRDDKQNTALHLAVFYNNFDIAQLLLNNDTIDCNAQNTDGNTVLYLAIAQYLKTLSDDNTPYEQKKHILTANISFIAELLKKNADANITNYHYCSPLSLVTSSFKTLNKTKAKILKDDYIALMQTLFHYNARANSAMLHDAITSTAQESVAIIDLLLQHGAFDLVRDEQDNTLFHLAVKRDNKSYEVLKLLITKSFFNPRTNFLPIMNQARLTKINFDPAAKTLIYAPITPGSKIFSPLPLRKLTMICVAKNFDLFNQNTFNILPDEINEELISTIGALTPIKDIRSKIPSVVSESFLKMYQNRNFNYIQQACRKPYNLNNETVLVAALIKNIQKSKTLITNVINAQDFDSLNNELKKDTRTHLKNILQIP